MKFREVVRAVSGFLYEVNEYDVFDTGKVTHRLVELKIDETNIRCMQHNMRHEKLVKGDWYIISPEDFDFGINFYKTNKIKVRKKDQTVQVTKPKVNLSLVDRLILTEHALDRLEERFGISEHKIKPFLEEKLKNHFIVQNYHVYTHKYKEHDPDVIAICSEDFKTVLIVRPTKNRYKVLTCYTPFDSNYTAFNDWFQDHMGTIHELPNLMDYAGV